jgi:hypothetical protein
MRSGTRSEAKSERKRLYSNRASFRSELRRKSLARRVPAVPESVSHSERRSRPQVAVRSFVTASWNLRPPDRIR